MVHLVLAALGAVAGEAQSLVGHQLSATRVDGGADGNTAGLVSTSKERFRDSDEGYEEGKITRADGSRGVGRASGFK